MQRQSLMGGMGYYGSQGGNPSGSVWRLARLPEGIERWFLFWERERGLLYHLKTNWQLLPSPIGLGLSETQRDKQSPASPALSRSVREIARLSAWEADRTTFVSLSLTELIKYIPMFFIIWYCWLKIFFRFFLWIFIIAWVPILPMKLNNCNSRYLNFTRLQGLQRSINPPCGG